MCGKIGCGTFCAQVPIIHAAIVKFLGSHQTSSPCSNNYNIISLGRLQFIANILAIGKVNCQKRNTNKMCPYFLHEKIVIYLFGLKMSFIYSQSKKKRARSDIMIIKNKSVGDRVFALESKRRANRKKIQKK